MRLSQLGVNDLLIEDLLRYHTPTQIEKGFEQYAAQEPDWIARLILKGRFGFRRTVREKRTAPKASKEQIMRAEQARIAQQEEQCLTVEQKQAQEQQRVATLTQLLDDYLQ